MFLRTLIFGDGYEISILFPQFIGEVNYTINNHPTDQSLKLLTVHSTGQFKDVQFVIENRILEMSQRKGYICYFDNGLFHLTFCFKREFREVK